APEARRGRLACSDSPASPVSAESAYFLTSFPSVRRSSFGSPPAFAVFLDAFWMQWDRVRPRQADRFDRSTTSAPARTRGVRLPKQFRGAGRGRAEPPLPGRRALSLARTSESPAHGRNATTAR